MTSCPMPVAHGPHVVDRLIQRNVQSIRGAMELDPAPTGYLALSNAAMISPTIATT